MREKIERMIAESETERSRAIQIQNFLSGRIEALQQMLEVLDTPVESEEEAVENE